MNKYYSIVFDSGFGTNGSLVETKLCATDASNSARDISVANGERDESSDVFVVTRFGVPLRVYPIDTQVIDSPDGSEDCCHYIPYGNYAALEMKCDQLRIENTNLRNECSIRESVEFRLREIMESSQARVRELEMRNGTLRLRLEKLESKDIFTAVLNGTAPRHT